MAITAAAVRNQLFPRSFDSLAGMEQKSWYGATKEIFIYGNDSGPTPSTKSHMLTFIAGPTGGDAHMTFKVPHDFNALVSAHIIVIPDATKSDWDIDTDVSFCKIGESHDTNTASETSETYDLTQDELAEINISALLSGITHKHYVGVHLENNHATDDIHVIGVRLRYV